MTPSFTQQKVSKTRRAFIGHSMVGALAGAALLGCSPSKLEFESTDLTGAPYAKDFRLKDHEGNVRTMADFRGKIVVIFFGFTQCPDVCPTSMNTMTGVKELLGDLGNAIQVLFITVDPERDQLPVLKAYMQNFDVYYKKSEGKTLTSYTMDHSAGKYIFDTQGNIRLFSAYGTDAKVIASDIKKLIADK